MAFLDKFRTKDIATDLHSDICNSLQKLLNTKRSYGSWQDNMGLDDYSYAPCCQEILTTLMHDIFYNIKHFEKRLQQPRLELLDSYNALWACFTLYSAVEGKPELFYILFNKKSTIEVSTLCPTLPPLPFSSKMP